MTIERLQGYLHLVAQVEGLGAAVDFPEVAAGHAALARAQAMAADAQRLKSLRSEDLATVAAHQYAAGEIDADRLAILASTKTADMDAAAAIIGQAIELVTSPATIDLRKIGDRWTLALRPIVSARMETLTRTARQMPELTPFRLDQLNWSDRGNLERALSGWTELETLLAALLTGAPAGITTTSNLVHRWLHPDRLATADRYPNGTYESLAVEMVRAGCTPGLWTTAEVSTGEPHPEPRRTGRRSAA